MSTNRVFCVLRDAVTPIYYGTFQQAVRASRNKKNHTSIFEVFPARLNDVQGKKPVYVNFAPSHIRKDDGRYILFTLVKTS